ncbi:hypothetical protein NWF24_14505 [Variovorax paradoxus]|uniref:hypothetical protein n=1 Tax=Variovorax paradoxus TaxID=34073 RepID=UPI0021ABD8F6|nr:hypothetical protein [Variovorax paradoxus]UVH60574.1 hypothetical protein NWF24_14505 [Variovorax paradoxus]
MRETSGLAQKTLRAELRGVSSGLGIHLAGIAFAPGFDVASFIRTKKANSRSEGNVHAPPTRDAASAIATASQKEVDLKTDRARRTAMAVRSSVGIDV